MANFNILDIIGILSLFIGLMFAVFLFSNKGANKLSNRIFASFLLLSAIDNVFLSKIVGHNSYNVSAVIALLVFFQLPIFYLYIVSVCYSDFKLKAIHLLHAIPFIIVNLLMLTNFYGVDSDSTIILLSNVSDAFKNSLVHIFIHIQVLSYLIAVFIVINRAKKIHLENYANSEITFYTWLFQLAIVLSVLHAFAILKNIYKFSDYDTFYFWSRVLLQLIELAIFCWYILKALKSPDLFRGVDSRLQLINNLTNNNNNNNADQNTYEIDILKTYMVEKEPFLDSTLTVQSLSEKIKLPSRELSILINKELGQHFFDFINEYRIEKAMSILKDSSKKKYTVLEILYKVGFNSKSSFNTAFKKHTGVTPTSFRKSKTIN